MLVRSQLFDIRRFGRPRPSPETLMPYLQDTLQRARDGGLPANPWNALPPERLDSFVRNADPNAELPGRFRFWIDHDLDDNGDGQVTLNEVALYGYRVDQMGNGDEIVQPEELKAARALSYKAYIQHEGLRVGLDETEREKLDELLLSDRFVATPDVDKYGTDILGASKDPEVTAHRTYQAATNLDDCEKEAHPHDLDNDAIDGLKKLQLQTLVKTGNMPRIFGDIPFVGHDFTLQQLHVKELKPENVKHGVRRFFFWENKLPVGKDEPVSGRKTVFRVNVPDEEEVYGYIVTVKDPDTYKLTPDDVAPWLEEVIEAAAASLQENPEVLEAIYDQCLQAVEGQEDIKMTLMPLAKLLYRAFGIRGSLGFTVTSQARDDEGGNYQDRDRLVSLHQQSMLKILKNARKRKVPPEQQRALLFEVLVMVMTHEFFHAAQASWLRNGSSATHPAQRARLEDYRKERRISGISNFTGYDAPLLSTLLTGKDEKYYRQTPQEVDAYKVGDDLAQRLKTWILARRNLPAQTVTEGAD